MNEEKIIEELDEEFRPLTQWISRNRPYAEWKEVYDLKERLKLFLLKALAKQREEIIGVVKSEIKFIDEGIEACKHDSALDDCVGKELHYIWGKSQALKIAKLRLTYILKELDKSID